MGISSCLKLRVQPFAIALIWMVVSSLCLLNASSADEVILDASSTGEHFSLGDFECSSCLHKLDEAMSIIPGSTHLTAGDLWTKLDASGVRSLDQLTLCLDMTPVSSKSMAIDSIEFVIKGNETKLADFSLDRNEDNNIVVPAYQASSYKPEVKLVANLGYDFMKQFSSVSNEQILLNVKLKDGTTLNPKYFIAGPQPMLSGRNIAFISGFTLFWTIVFLGLYRLTHPSRKSGELKVAAKPRSVIAPNRQVVEQKLTA